MTQHRNSNPVVYRGVCYRCGEPVTLSSKDADDYTENPHRGLVHFVCPSPDLASLPNVPGGDWGSDG